MTSTSRTLSARAEVRKQDIIRCAAEVFSVHGYAKARMTDIADAAGVTKGLLYWYFANKETLVAEIVRDVHEQLRFVQRAATSPLEEPLDKVYVGTVASVRFILENFRLFQINVPLTDELRAVSGATANVHASDTAAALRDGQERGTIRSDDDPSALAQGNAGIVNQFCVAHASGVLAGGIDDVAHMAARFLVRGLAADAASIEGTLSRHGVAPAAPKRRRSEGRR